MKLLKLTKRRDGSGVWVNMEKVVAFDRATARVPESGTDIVWGPDSYIGVTETPEQIAAMLAELEREAWRQMEECRRSIQSAMVSIEEAAMAVRNAQ